MRHKLHFPQGNARVPCSKSYTSLRERKGFRAAEATPPLENHKDSMWQKLHLPRENTRIPCGKSYIAATPPSGKHSRVEVVVVYLATYHNVVDLLLAFINVLEATVSKKGKGVVDSTLRLASASFAMAPTSQAQLIIRAART